MKNINKKPTKADLIVKLFFIILYIAGAVYIGTKQDRIAASVGQYEMLADAMRYAMRHSLRCYLIAAGAALVILLHYPLSRKIVRTKLESIGLKNAAGEVPMLLHKYMIKGTSKVTVWEFLTWGIPLKAWENKQADIEAALNVTITNMKNIEGKSKIILYTVPAKADLPDMVTWDNCYLSKADFILCLGKGYTGPITVDLANIPHILLGGSTGSGKTVLLKCLLMQAVQKGAVVCIADFKGGVDYTQNWIDKCRICLNEQELLEILDSLIATLLERKELFRKVKCPNIAEYNIYTDDKLPRYIFACDEVAEILDKTGADSERKKLLSQIENKLSTIARQGRAFGIHLILATQRPDANILPGQIKNNIDCRICGRADNVLSQIILDSTSAADLVPKDAQGRFLLNDGTVFQGFWLGDGR